MAKYMKRIRTADEMSDLKSIISDLQRKIYYYFKGKFIL